MHGSTALCNLYKNMVCAAPLPMCATQEARERAAAEEARREAEEDAAREAERSRQAELEAMDVASYRKTLAFKAKPMPKFE